MLQQSRSYEIDGRGLEDEVCLHHVCGGRARLGVGGLKSSPALAQLMASALGEINGVRDVRPSTITGNVVVLFDTEAVTSQTLLRLARAVISGDLVPGGAGFGGAPWHTMSVQAVSQRLMTSVQSGLSSSAANERLAESGKNVLASGHVRSPGSILAEQVTTFPVAVLACAAGVSLVTGALLEAVAIAAVVGLNAAIGYTSEMRAERVLASLEADRAPVARLLRDGRMREIEAEALVPGDVIHLQRGDVVPADARVTQAAGLSVSEAALTGESLPVSKTVEALASRVPLAERTNMLYRGTVVTGGSASAIVVATGVHTEVGRVQRLVAISRPPQTPMQRQLDELGLQLVWIMGLASVALFVIGIIRGQSAFTMLRSALSLAVAAIPEGLPMVATTTLAVGVERMGRRGMVVRRINAIETLASVNVVCFDKTGTLTLNQMTLAELSGGGRTLSARELATQRERGSLGSDQQRLLEICCLCSEVELEPDGRDAFTVEGSATETALVRATMAAGINPRLVRSRHPLVSVQHRSEAYRFMATLHHAPGGALVAVKGDPLEVISRCSSVLDPDGRIRALTTADRKAIEEANLDMANRALRVLGFAYDERVGVADRMLLDGLTWVGLAGLSDPVRPGVGDVLQRLEAAGVRSIMLTGDAPVTARAVAAEIGLGNGREVQVLTADALARQSEEDRALNARRADIFARVSPAQKLEIVRALQASGAVVAMLGDGINDSPALRAADVGLAVGHNGDAAAREVADIYLENEDLGLLVEAIEQGRATQASVRRSLDFLLGTNGSEVALLLAASALGRGEALSPAQLLWINLVTDVLPGIALALEPPEGDLMTRKPQARDVPIVDSEEIRQLGRDGAMLAGSALAAGLLATPYGGGAAQSQTIMFATLTGSQLLHAINCRSRRSGPADQPISTLGAVVGGSLAVQGAAFVLPVTRRLLGLAPLGSVATSVALGSMLTCFLGIRSARRAAQGRKASASSSRLHFVRGASGQIVDGSAARSSSAVRMRPDAAQSTM